MKALVQRVTEAHVTVGGETVGAIKKGVVVLIGVTHTDTQKEADFLAEKIANLRIFPGANPDSDFDTSVLENKFEVLAVSQFTLYAGTARGRRPDFAEAARPETAEPLYDYFVKQLQAKGLRVATGKFGAMMEVHLVNDGPLTLIIESK